MTTRTTALALCTLFAVSSCGDDDGRGSEAIRRGVGAECGPQLVCEELGQECLTEFSAGYCAVRDCAVSADCPDGSACVTDPDFDGVNYCFLVCLDKPDCNLDRSPENESECTSSIDFVDPEAAGALKVCRPSMGS